jgi:hypothetical protein
VVEFLSSKYAVWGLNSPILQKKEKCKTPFHLVGVTEVFSVAVTHTCSTILGQILKAVFWGQCVCTFVILIDTVKMLSQNTSLIYIPPHGVST